MLKLYVVALVVLAGCSPKATQETTQLPFLDHVLTVSDFRGQHSLMDKVVEFCANDPGRTRDNANCINAMQAMRMGPL